MLSSFCTAALVLGLLVIVTLWKSRHTTPDGPRKSLPSGRRPWRAGFISNLLNPKIAVFYTGLLPQLVPRGAPTVVSLIGLVLIHIVLSLAYLNLYALLLHTARQTVQRPRVRALLDRVTGVALIGLGTRVATLSR